MYVPGFWDVFWWSFAAVWGAGFASAVGFGIFLLGAAFISK